MALKRSREYVLKALLLGVVLFILSAILSPFPWVNPFNLSRTPGLHTPFITHIVLFQFKSTVDEAAIDKVVSEMVALKQTCVHPTTGSPYIQSITGGRDNSIESLQDGISHAFVVQFSSKADRDYYVNHDPAHQAFKIIVKEYLEKAQVVDFQEGLYT